MKLLVLLLGLSLTLAAYVPSGYTEIPLETAIADSEIQDALNFGVDSVLTNLVNSKNIHNTDFEVSTIHSVAQLVQSSTTFYAFETEMKNEQQTTTIKSKFIVQKLKSGTKQLYSSSSSISASNTFTPTFLEVPASEYQSSAIIHNIRKYGLDQVINQLLQKYPKATTPFTVKNTNSVLRSIISNNQVIYKFNIQAHNNAGFVVSAAYAVSYNPNTAAKSVLTSNYAIVVTDKHNDLNGLGRDYFTVPASEVANNAVIQNIIAYGVQEVQKLAFAKGTLPNTDFMLEQTKSVARQVDESNIDYRVEVVLNDKKNSQTAGIFVVRYFPRASTLALYAYTIHTKTT